jgi:hypothetical protein
MVPTSHSLVAKHGAAYAVTYTATASIALPCGAFSVYRQLLAVRWHATQAIGSRSGALLAVHPTQVSYGPIQSDAVANTTTDNTINPSLADHVSRTYGIPWQLGAFTCTPKPTARLVQKQNSVLHSQGSLSRFVCCSCRAW